MVDKVKCKHGEFDPMMGCPKCIAENQLGEDAGAEVKVVDLFSTSPISPNQDITVISLSDQANKYLIYAEGREIFTNNDVKEATQELSFISNTKKAIKAKRQEYVGPLNAQVKEINAFFETLTDPIGEADKITRRKVLDYNDEIERQIQEALRIEEEKLRLAREETALKGEHTVDLTPVEAPAPTPDRVRTEAGMTSKTGTWKYTVSDFGLLPDEYKVPDTAMLNSIAKKHHDGKQIPGVIFYFEPGLQVRSK